MSDGTLPSGANDSTHISHYPFVFTCVFIPIQILSVALRYLSRFLVRNAWGFDDILIFVSLLFQVGLGVITLGTFVSRSSEKVRPF
jgi:hypothetical protein